MDALAIIVLIILIAIISIIYLVVRRAVHKAGNAVERKIRSGTASNEEELLRTVVYLQTAAPLYAIRQSVAQTVTVKSSLMHGRMKTTHDSERGIAWEVGSVSFGEGFQSQLTYKTNGSEITGTYRITQMGRLGGVSEYTKKMEQQRDEVILAFRSIDPNTRITTGYQDMTGKMDWL